LYFVAQRDPSPSPSTSTATPPPSYHEINPLGGSKTVYIKQVELLLNNNAVDQLDTRETLEDCIVPYWRMFNMGGFGRSLFTNGITYDAFK